jgi:23S rRNA-/tRNA-specific pseudouridylate synthase
MGYPLLGDEKYGARFTSLKFARPALHSARMEFPHPMTKELLRFDDPVPADMAAIFGG